MRYVVQLINNGMDARRLSSVTRDGVKQKDRAEIREYMRGNLKLRQHGWRPEVKS
jgi:hypothetical protein